MPGYAAANGGSGVAAGGAIVSTPARPYPLTIEQDADGSYVVSDEVTLVYGWGETEDAALLDYDVSLQEYQELCAAEGTTERQASRG